MKYFNIDGQIDTELVDRFALFLNENSAENICIFLDSPGGWFCSARIMCTIINADKSRFSLIASHTVMSAAFWLFYEAKCKREILSGTVGMYHIARRDFKMKATGSMAEDFDEFYLKEFKACELQRCDEFSKALGMLPYEQFALRGGFDVFFSEKSMRTFLEQQQ